MNVDAFSAILHIFACHASFCVDGRTVYARTVTNGVPACSVCPFLRTLVGCVRKDSHKLSACLPFMPVSAYAGRLRTLGQSRTASPPTAYALLPAILLQSPDPSPDAATIEFRHSDASTAHTRKNPHNPRRRHGIGCSRKCFGTTRFTDRIPT